jgi:acetylornithine deacetylase
MKNYNEILLDLLKIESFSNQENNVCDYVFKLLEREGFLVEKKPVDANGYNIVAKIGQPKIFFSTHLDVVPGFVPVRETDTTIFGRGACDAKGPASAIISAALLAKEEGLKNFGLIFTVGEESDFRGVRNISGKIDIPFVVVGEPTSLRAVNGHFGVSVFKIMAKGKSVHSSKAKQGINAIDKLLEAIKLLRKIKTHKETFYSVCKISGGTADNVIPDFAEAIVSFRVSPKDKTDYLKEIKKTLRRGSGQAGKIEVKKILEIKSVFSAIPKEISFLKNSETVPYATELSFYKNGIVLGPGNINFAHTNNEQIKKSDIEKAIKIYRKIIVNFCK